ncbi:MAG: GNAT family N-acetyltransferase, partial [Actinomycetes bacterium]
MNFPDDVPRLTDGVVTLRAHSLSDVPALTEQATDPVMVEWTTVPVPSSDETSLAYVTEVIATGWRKDTEWSFAVEAEDEDGVPRFVGSVSLRNAGDRRAEIAYGAHPWARGRGLVVRALDLLLDWGFETKRLDMVIWWAHKGNWPSRKAAWRLGFSFDGTVRQWMP